jgi:hypothetical protein
MRRQRRRIEEDHEQGHGMEHAGHRRPRTEADVGRRAGDGARRRESAEERRRDVGDALSHQFGVRGVAIATESIGHDGREQRFDGSEHRHGHRR